MTDAGQAINRHSTVPLYKQVTELLAHDYLESAAPGSRLPSEVALSEHFGVHRLTVRKALEELSQLGLVRTEHGRGTFVAEPPMRYEIAADESASFTRTMRAKGHTVETRRLKRLTENVGQIQDALGTDQPLCRTDLHRLVDGEPWSLTSTWFATGHYPDLAEAWDGSASLYAVLEERFGIQMRRLHRSFAALPAGREDAEWLMIQVGFPILEVRGLNVDQDGRPVAFVRHHFRGDHVQFTTEF